MSLGWALGGGAIGSALTWLLIGKSSPLQAAAGFRRAAVDASIMSTSLKAEISMPYAAMVRAFGHPDKPDTDGKTFNEWFFKGPGGPFVVHDWKRDNSKGRGGRNWHVGGRSDPAAFLGWLNAKVAQSS